MGSKTTPTTLRRFSKYIFGVHFGTTFWGEFLILYGLKVDYIDFLKLKFSTFVQSTFFVVEIST